LEPTIAVGYLLETLLGEIELDGIQEITIATLQPEVVEVAERKFNLYRNNLASRCLPMKAVSVDTLGIAHK